MKTVYRIKSKIDNGTWLSHLATCDSEYSEIVETLSKTNREAVEYNRGLAIQEYNEAYIAKKQADKLVELANEKLQDINDMLASSPIVYCEYNENNQNLTSKDHKELFFWA